MAHSPVAEALARVRQAPFLLDGYRATEPLLTAAAATTEPPRIDEAVDLLGAAVADTTDQLTTIAAIHALGVVADERAAAVLCELLSRREAFVREHAAWSIGSQPPQADAIARLVSLVAAGDFSGVLAQRTLSGWAEQAPDLVAPALEVALIATEEPAARARLAESLGLAPGRIALRVLHRLATDTDEHLWVRRSAIAAIGDRRYDPSAVDIVRRLAGTAGDLGATARLALHDLTHRPDDGRATDRSTPRTDGGLTVAQLFLHADLDPSVSMAGAGDNGGVATLLVRLGGALADQDGIDRVITLSRGSEGQAALGLVPAARHQLVSVSLLPRTLPSTKAWPAWIAAQRGIRRALIAHGPVDVLHLRMGEVGSMAAAAAAGSLGIPVVFTLAPDPHTVVHAHDMSGSMSRTDFGDHDATEHFWFRLELVRTLADTAAKVVLFPRADLAHDLKDLVGVDIHEDSDRYRVVPEGIDITVTARALQDATAATHRRTGQSSAADATSTAECFEDLSRLFGDLPAHRQGLPIAISVGRLHRVKGMATVAEAWANDPELRARCNLLIVGGDLTAPSEDERSQLDAIHRVLATTDPTGLVLAGHRSNDTVARWLAVARLGLGDLIAPDGFYVCGSVKEEFGLAILEALATGLVVVAPDSGGPATYIEHRRTGVLARTSDPVALAEAMSVAADLAVAPDRPANRARAQRTVREKFTVQAMASALARVYEEVASSSPTGRIPSYSTLFGISTVQSTNMPAGRS